jgi:hypothetical protein
MAIATSGQLSALLKKQYEGPIREQLNLEALIYRLFSEGPHTWSGDKVIIPLHTAGVDATSIAYKSESAAGAYIEMPQATSQTYIDLTVGAKHLYASFEVTGQAEAKAPGNAGGSEAAFIGAMYSEMRGLEKDVRSSMNKDMFTGQGFPGFLVDNQASTVKAGRRVSGANHLVNGDVVQLWHVPADLTTNWTKLVDGNGGGLDTFTVGAVDSQAGTCSLTSSGGAANAGPDATGVADTDLVVMEKVTGLAAAGAGVRLKTLEINGLNCLAFGAAAGDAYGNARDAANNPILRGFGFKNAPAAAAAGGMSSGQPLTLSDMQLVVDSIAERCEEDVDCVIMHRFTRAQFRNLAQENIRYLPGETVGDLGHRPGDLAFEDIPITVSKDVPYGVIYFLVKDTINTYTLRPGGFQQFTDNGDIITQKRSTIGGGTAALLDVREGFWKQYYNLVSELPRAIGVMAGISYKRG